MKGRNVPGFSKMKRFEPARLKIGYLRSALMKERKLPIDVRGASMSHGDHFACKEC